MSKKAKGESNREFIKQVIRGSIGVVILIILLVLWFTWDGVYRWFYTNVAPNSPKDTLLIFWLLLLFPLLAAGVSLTVDGGLKAYRLVAPPKEKD